MIYLASSTKRFKCKEPGKGALFSASVDILTARAFIAARGDFTAVFDEGFDSSSIFTSLRLGYKVTTLFLLPGEKALLEPDDMIFIVTKDKDMFNMIVIKDAKEVRCGETFH